MNRTNTKDFAEQFKAEQASKKNSSKKTTNYAEICLEFMTKQKKPLVAVNGVLYRYVGNKYEEFKNLSRYVRRFLVSANHQHSDSFTKNVTNTLLDLLHCEGEIPFMKNKPDTTHNFLAFKNCLYDIDSGKTYEHTKDWVSTHCLDFDYDPESKCPLWLKFIDEAFDGDPQRKRLLQQWFGYCLTSDISQHKFMICVGLPRSGKGTTASILAHMLNKDATTAYQMSYFANPFGLKRLVNKNVAFIGEVNLAGSKDKNTILEKLNSIVGGDEQPIELKHSNEGFTTTLTTKFHICCNEIPNFLDPSGALAARMLVLNYDESFYGREDRTLVDKLKAESSGICNWALEGLADFKACGGFTPPERSKRDLDEVLRTNSPVMAFLHEKCVANPCVNSSVVNMETVDGETYIPIKTLASEYADWCEINSICSNSITYFGNNLRSVLPKVEKKKKQYNGKRCLSYIGIDLKVKDSSIV